MFLPYFINPFFCQVFHIKHENKGVSSHRFIFNAMSLNLFNDKSLLELGIGLALEASLGVPSYHLTIGNLKHGNIQ